jgi:hypothetical protein
MSEPSVEERVAVLEALQGTIQKDVEEIKVNHLPHIERKIDSLRNWMLGAMFTAFIALMGITANLVVQFILHTN